MLCNECGKNEANVHLTHIINGKKTENHLCEECAKQNQSFFNSSFSMKNMFSAMLNNTFNNKTYLPTKECSNCGITYDNFRTRGKFGCSKCIDSFKVNLIPVIRNTQGYDRHIGKIPKRAGGKYKVQMDMEKLKKDLKDAVDQEEYELAAELRDKIHEMENKMQGDE